jgi:hypothetical protein
MSRPDATIFMQPFLVAAVHVAAALMYLVRMPDGDVGEACIME